MITITNIIAIAIAIAITIIIRPGPNAHIYAQNRWEAGSRYRRKICIGDLLSRISKSANRL